MTSTTPPAPTTPKPPLSIGPHDVLLGRGGATNNHDGNKRYRTIVADHQAEYLGARKKDKAIIARNIVAIVQANGGRFLKKEGNDWEVVEDKRCVEKTSQALREGLDVRNHTVRPRKQVRRYYDAKQAAQLAQPAAVVVPNVMIPTIMPQPTLLGTTTALQLPMQMPLMTTAAAPATTAQQLQAASIPELQQELQRRALLLQTLAMAHPQQVAAQPRPSLS